MSTISARIDHQISITVHLSFELENFVLNAWAPLPPWKGYFIQRGLNQLAGRIKLLCSYTHIYEVSYFQYLFILNLQKTLGRISSEFHQLSPMRVCHVV